VEYKLMAGGLIPNGAAEAGRLLLLTTADTEILAAARASERLPEEFPKLSCANPAALEDPAAFFERELPGAGAVLVRLLGGRRAWPGGLEELRRRCARLRVPLLAFGGEAEPDAELAALSSVPSGTVLEAFEYLRHGGVRNTENLLRFVADTVLMEGYGFEPASPLPEVGIYHPGLPEDSTLEELLARHDPARPTVGVIFYRAHWMSGNTAFVDALVEALEAAGADALPVYCYSLRAGPDGRVQGLEILKDRVDCLITTVLAGGGSNAADARRSGSPEEWLEWDVPALEELGVPVIQGICTTSTREAWVASDAGLSPLDTAWQVAIPEFDGRIIGVPFSFKERLGETSPVGTPLTLYKAHPERTARLAGLAARFANLGRIPNSEKRVAVLLSNYPTKHSRVGNAVGLDTPASAIGLLDAMWKTGYTVEGAPERGDELIHSLVAAGGHDLEFLTEAQLGNAAGRLGAKRYTEWFGRLPEDLRSDVEEHWGRPPGDLYVDGDEFVVAGLSFGNVFVGIQPPRGFGENPIAIYHDPDLPPTHHYLAAYWWMIEEFGADALVHLGKHGTLEWLPGKSLGLSPSCAPDAALREVPLFYPFVVNDPGEGTQAKRRAHATVVDHLIPPMTRAETYDDLAKLEQLLDEYYQVETLDPSKLPAIRVRIWETLRNAELHRDLGVEEQPEEFSDFLTHVDGYLCEIKDLPIRGGLHTLGETPDGESLRHLLASILRLGAGGVPGLRVAAGAAFGLDERVLAENGGTRVEAPSGLVEHFPGTVVTASDLLDRLEEAQQALLRGMEERGWDAYAAGAVCQETLGFADAGVERSLRFAAEEVVPRLMRTPEEMGNLLSGLGGGYVPAGPSGSPTRGLVNVLPTGRNFYSVDPKALPSALSWEVGQGLADDLLRRYLEDEDRYPETVGIVVWGTAAMRTQGDDVSEILALLGVRPVWNEESRRVFGLEVIPLKELGRPRIDVTVRISGFFRDAFPNLISLLDVAFTTVANLDEPDDMNFVNKHVGEEKSRGADERRSTTRIFGSKPGAYGAGLLPLMDARNWRTDEDLAEVYAVWGGYAYGRGLDGVEAREAMESNLRRTEVAVKNVDNREHDLFDSDDYFQYHGGMIAAVRALTGRDPKAYIGDSADPSRVKTRDLSEEARRVFRSRVANPKWITAMRRHGYKGAFELSATVDYLFGYDATAGVVEDWMYSDVTRKYVLDQEVRDFMQQSNPWALRAISERLLEATQRGLWSEPDTEDLEALKQVYLENEGMLEEGIS
jgi:cobaltochelatase CobN